MMRTTRTKKRRERLIAWAQQHPQEVLLLWQDESWFSRFAQPRLKAWGEQELQQRMVLPQTPDKALCYYGVKRHDTGEVYLYRCLKRPNSDETIQFLHWIVLGAALERKKAVVVVWDNASWHVGQKVKRWIRRYNQQAKREGKVRLLVWHLPKRSPWLNSIEPHWQHGKKRVCEPTDKELTPHELQRRLFEGVPAKFIAQLPQRLS